MGALNPKYAGGGTGGEAPGGTVDPAQVQAIVDTSIATKKPEIVQAAVTAVEPTIQPKIDDALASQTPQILAQAAEAAQTKVDTAKAATLSEAATAAQAKVDAAKPGIISEAVTQANAGVDTKVNSAVEAAKPSIKTDVEASINSTMDSKIQTQVQSQLGQTVIDEVGLQLTDAAPSIEQNVITAVNQDMLNNIDAMLNLRQPTIVDQVKTSLTPEIDAAVVAHEPAIVQAVTDATTQNLNGLVDNQVVTHYPAIVQQMWDEVDTQVQQQLADSFQSERTTIIDQVLNSIGDVDRAEVIVSANRGIKADAKHRTSGGVMALNSTTFNDINMVFADSDIGKPFYVAGAGVGGTTLVTSIVSRTDIRTVELAHPAAVAVTSAEYLFGTDDTAGWNALMASIFDNMVATIVIPYGLSLTDPFALKNNVKIMGTQSITPGQTQIGNVSGLVLKPGTKAAGLLSGASDAITNVQLERLIVDGADRLQPTVITRYNGGSTAKGNNVFNATNGNFTAADIGKKLVIYGAGSNGGDYVGTIFGVNSPQQVVVDQTTDPHPFGATTNNVAYAYGFYTAQGSDGVTTAGSAVFNAASANFTADDVGRAIELTAVMNSVWAGDSRGELLSTRIKAVNSPTQVVLEVAADLALTSVRWRVGMVHGVFQVANAAETTASWTFEHVIFRFTSGAGFVSGHKQRSNKFYRTYAYRCRGMGLLLNSSLNELDQSGAIQCGGDGATVLRPNNRLSQFRAAGNNGNGTYVAPAAEGTSLVACTMENNDRNGLLALAKNVQRIGNKYISNSQCTSALYSDVALTRRYTAGSVGVTPAGQTEHGSQWFLSGNGSKPNWGVESATAGGVRGDGVQFDPATSPFIGGAVSQSTVFAVAAGSMVLDANAVLTLLNNNVISAPGLNGAKIGASAAEKLGFFGNTPIVKPVATGKTREAAVRSLAAALASLGLITNNIT